MVVGLGDVINAIQWGDVAIHAKHAIGNDQGSAIAGILAFLDLGSQVIGVTVCVTDDLRAGQPAAIDDAGVVEFVGVNHVLL